MADRERKRAQRRKRKERGLERMQRGYSRSEARNREAREALQPLQQGERPLVVTIAAALSALVAVATIVGWLAGAEVQGDRPELVEVLAPALLFGVMAWGMWKARYWAVLGFQVLLIFVIFSGVFGVASQSGSVWRVLVTLSLIAVAGTLFWFMVKAMARIQMPHRLPRE